MATPPPATPARPRYESCGMVSSHTLEMQNNTQTSQMLKTAMGAQVCGGHTAVVFIRAVLAVTLAVALWVESADATSISAAEGEV